MTDPRGGGQRKTRIDDQLVSCLQHRYRRWTLWCLAQTDASLHLADVAREIAHRESSTAKTTPTEDTARSIYIQLYHNHIPKLNETDMVSFNSDEKLVSLTVDPNVILARLDSECEL